MCTSGGESIQFLDLDLLFSSAPTSTENTSIIEDVYIDQNFSLLENTEQVNVQNERNTETINYKAEYLKLLRCLEEKNKHYDHLQKCSEEKNKDYDQLKQQYIKLGQDYAELHYESKKNALEAIKANTSFEKITEELEINRQKMIAIENQYSVTNTLHKAALSNNNQLTKLVEKLDSDVTNSKNTIRSYKEAIKEEKRNNATSKYKIKTYEEDLCSIAGKLDRAIDKKHRDRETQRLISKYNKNKLNTGLENIDSESVDTGRGSSFSNYSPAYSINFSPLNMIENFEQKMMKDASTSPQRTNDTFDLAKLSITSPSLGTKSNKIVVIDSTKKNIKTEDTASSPISFVDEMEKITTVDTASSPISFVEVTKNITTVDTASSPISFVEVTEKITTVDTPSSPISFSQDEAKLTDIAFSSLSGIISPVARAKFKDRDYNTKSTDIAISPIYVPKPSSPVPKSPSWESTASLIEFIPLKSADVAISAIEVTDITRSLKPTAVTNSVVQTPEMTSLRKLNAMTNSVIQTPEMTRPQNPNDVTSPLVQTLEMTSPRKLNAMASSGVQTPEIIRPQKLNDVTSPVVQTPEMTSPRKLNAVTNSVVQTTEMTRPQKPNYVTSPVVQTPEMTSPRKLNAVICSVVQTPEMTRPQKPNDVTSPVVQTPEMTSPRKLNAMTSSVVQTPQMTKPQRLNDVASPVVQTPEITRPLQSADVVERSSDKTPEMNRSLDPTAAPRPTVETSEMTRQLKHTAVTKDAILLTGPNDTNDVKRRSITTKISEMARPIEARGFINQETETTTSKHETSLENNNISVISKTPELTQLINATNVRRSVIQTPSRPVKYTDARRPLIITKTLAETKQNENIKISEKSLTKNLTEIQSHIAQDNDQERDDLEVGMILNKFRLDWNALSPMSITPDLDEEGLVQSESDVRNDKTERQSSEHSRPQISKESDSLLVITPDYKKLTIPQNMSNTLKYKINEDNSSHLKRNKLPKPHSIHPIRHTSVHNNNETERQSDITMHLRKREAPVKIHEKNTKRNNKIEMPQSPSEIASNISSIESQSDLLNIPYSELNSLSHTSGNQLTEYQELLKKEYLLKEKQTDSIVCKRSDSRRSERIKSTIPAAQSTANSVPQTQKLQSSHIDNISISREPQSNTRKPPERRRSERINSTIPAPQCKTKIVPQTQMKLQSSPIDDMSISKEQQFITHNPPERRRSERIKFTIPAAQSKTKSVPLIQTNLQTNPIDNMSISKEPQSNTRNGCPPIISNPEYGRKRTICRSMEAQSKNQNSKRQKNAECNTSKCNSAEIYSEDKFTYSYSKPPMERISRVKEVSSNTKSVPKNNQSENISDKTIEAIKKDLSYTPPSKRAKLADDKTGFIIKPDQNMNENDNTKMSITHASISIKNNNPAANLKSTSNAVTTCTTDENNHQIEVSAIEQCENEHGRYCTDYNDIKIFNTDNNNQKTHINKMNKKGTFEWTHNLLDKMIFQYGSNHKIMNKSSIINKAKCEDKIAKEIENAVTSCVTVSATPNKYHETLQKAVAELEKHSDISKITGGLFKYLKSRDRKAEFLPGNKDRNYRQKPTPTKYVVSLMQIIDSIDKNGLKIWEPALETCRYLLFSLDKNVTPCLDVVESVTHLFVYMCQYNGRSNAKSLLHFMMAAMYCANYRAIIIIKDCLDLVPEILPHENERENTLYSLKPLFQTFIFLLHFYNCEDQLQKVQNVRFILKRRYCYDPTQDNETTILYMLKQTIMKINDHYMDNDMLEYSFLILAKRKGTKWCHKNIVQKILLPIIKGEMYTSKAAFRFCLKIITKLLKPYNKEMTVHSVEIVNLLMDIIKQPHPQDVKEDIISGLMCINMKNVTDRVNTYLANWNPPSISPKFEEALKKYIQRKPLKYWMYVDKSPS